MKNRWLMAQWLMADDPCCSRPEAGCIHEDGFPVRQPSAMGVRFLLLCACVVGVLAASGCIRRTVSITSEPDGAQLIVNGEAAGRTPARLVYHHHGVYRVELRKPGYEPVLEKLKLGAKLYERVPIDFATDVLWPGTIVDARKVHYRLKKLPRFNLEEVAAAAQRAAVEAEKAIPRLYKAPPPRPGAKDRALVPGAGKSPEPGKKKRPADPAAPAKPKKPGEPAKKPGSGDLDDPPDVPEIEEGREK